jgi:hypothetical protein
MLLDSNVLLDCCPAEKKGLARRMLAKLALRTAFHKARNGYKADALRLVSLYPQMRDFGPAWRQCQFAITFSKILPYWVRFKCRVGPPTRLTLKKIAYVLKLKQPPSEI